MTKMTEMPEVVTELYFFPENYIIETTIQMGTKIEIMTLMTEIIT